MELNADLMRRSKKTLIAGAVMFVVAMIVAVVMIVNSSSHRAPKATDIWKTAPRPLPTNVAGLDLMIPAGWQVVWQYQTTEAIIARPETCSLKGGTFDIDTCTQVVKIDRSGVSDDDTLSVADGILDKCNTPLLPAGRARYIKGASFFYAQAVCTLPSGRRVHVQAWNAQERALQIVAVNADNAEQMFVRF